MRYEVRASPEGHPFLACPRLCCDPVSGGERARVKWRILIVPSGERTWDAGSDSVMRGSGSWNGIVLVRLAK